MMRGGFKALGATELDWGVLDSGVWDWVKSDTGYLRQLQNRPRPIRNAWDAPPMHFPIFCGFGQFNIYILSL
jgi:hypothetical protein